VSCPDNDDTVCSSLRAPLSISSVSEPPIYSRL
jgi:hypothetical protein